MSAVAIPTPVPSAELDLTPRPGEHKRWTVEQYLALCAADFIGPDDRVELLEGEIIYKMSQNPPHIDGIRLIVAALRETLGENYLIDSQLPVRTPDSVPEPDAMVLRGNVRDYLGRYPKPEEIVLVAEVANTTLAGDRSRKAGIYARAGFVEYWILNVADRQLEVFRNPHPSGVYAEGRVLGENESVLIEGRELPVKDLLP